MNVSENYTFANFVHLVGQHFENKSKFSCLLNALSTTKETLSMFSKISLKTTFNSQLVSVYVHHFISEF